MFLFCFIIFFKYFVNKKGIPESPVVQFNRCLFPYAFLIVAQDRQIESE